MIPTKAKDIVLCGMKPSLEEVPMKSGVAFINLPPTVNHLILYSDRCGGQNKNNIIVFMDALQKIPNLQTIDQKFLIHGHTHMEKQKKRRQMSIEHPHDWAQSAKSACRKKPFVFDMLPYWKVTFNCARLLNNKIKSKLTPGTFQFTLDDEARFHDPNFARKFGLNFE
jgi:hypothetical protein